MSPLPGTVFLTFCVPAHSSSQSLEVHCSVFLQLPGSDIRFISEEHILNKMFFIPEASGVKEEKQITLNPQIVVNSHN
ncbi:hypothetical protein H8959_004118 [Pygathrix nigripes]